MQIVIASGKGGTGKTTVTSNLGYVLSQSRNVTLVDCDVEEPNLGIFFPCVPVTHDVQVLIPELSEDLCTHCGACGDFCRFGALTVLQDRVLFFPQLCHSCGGCFRVCPVDALKQGQVLVGHVQTCQYSKQLNLVSGRLREGDVRTTVVIHAVRKQVQNNPFVLIDAPPGTACPFIETVDEATLCVLVTEPTPFGLHDLSVAVDVLSFLKVPAIVVINRSDGHDEPVEAYCAEHNLPVVMKIPLDFTLLKKQNEGILITQEDPEWFKRFFTLGEQILAHAMGEL